MNPTTTQPQSRFLAKISPSRRAAQQVAHCLGFLESQLVAYPRASLKFLLIAAVTKRCVRILLIGKHGSGKSTAARLLGKLLDKKTAIYNAAVDDLISIAGIPNTKLFADSNHVQGIPFVTHARSIWDKQVVHCDELNRTTTENQNVFLEPLSEQTLYGQDLPMELFVATVNSDADDQYLGVMPLDAALRDRFDIVIQVPSAPSLMASDLQQVARVNMLRDDFQNTEIPNVDELVTNIERRRAMILDSNAMVNAIADWCGHVAMMLMKIKPDRYISQRSVAQFARFTTDALAFESLLCKLTTQIVRQLLLDITKVCLGNKFELCADELQAGVRAQEVNTVLQQLVKLDQIDNLSIGPLPARIRQLDRLDPQLSASDTLRVELAVSELVEDATKSGFTAAQQLAIAVPCGYEHARQEAELNVLNHRIQTLLRLKNQSVPSQRKHLTDRASGILVDPDVWRPSASKWTRSFFLKSRKPKSGGTEAQLEPSRFAFSMEYLRQNNQLKTLESGLWLLTLGSMAEQLLTCLKPVDPVEFASMQGFLELIHTSAVRSCADSWFGIVGCRAYRNGYCLTGNRLESALKNTPFANEELRLVFRLPCEAIPTYFAVARRQYADAERVFHPASLILQQLEERHYDLVG